MIISIISIIMRDAKILRGLFLSNWFMMKINNVTSILLYARYKVEFTSANTLTPCRAIRLSEVDISPYEYSASEKRREICLADRYTRAYKRRQMRSVSRKKIIRHVLRAASFRSRKASFPCICKFSAIVPVALHRRDCKCNFQTVLWFIVAQVGRYISIRSA